ncbi:CPBP family intramembrane glutamic endopeptidase [Ureibacillus sp. FSL K6-8385]|nr:CPBP family intramembrane metalloprotease [Ureibacillus terrenus]MED3762852.1 CPBP family intramembrane metalloprotease [Ureibacillus terrenus]
MPVLPAIGWGLAGFFMIYLGQIIGVQIESSLGIKPGSENTEAIINVTKTAPIMILASVIFGPILEELVFRRVIFGSIMEAQNNFWVAAFVSSIFFAIIHLDFSHIILYTITGFIFAFLYNKTKRLITPIISHMLLNGFVTYMQLNLDNIQQFFNQ